MAKQNTNANVSESMARSFPLHETLDMVQANLAYQLSGEPMYVPVWCGNPGMGKTTHAKLIADKLNLDMYYVSMYRPTEFFEGLPITNTISFENDKEKEKNLYVLWSEPEMIHIANQKADNALKNGKRGALIFLDDMHIMSPDVQKCFFELVLERALGNFKLRDNICMLGAMNSSSLAGFDGFFSAINNRIQKIYVEMPFTYWYEKCGADLNPLVAGYVRSFRDSLEEKESTDQPFATYRSWVQLSKLMDVYYKAYTDTHNIGWFLNKIFILACSLMSKQKAQGFKENIGQQLKYNYEAMVVNNSFSIERDDVIAQYCFANVIRYLRNPKDVENLTNYLVRLLDDNNGVSEYESSIQSVMYEVKAFKSALENKNDKESRDRYNLINAVPVQLFKKGKNKVHAILRKLTDPDSAQEMNEISKIEL